MISKRGELAVQTRRIAIGILLLWGGVKPRSPRGVMEAIANPVSHSRTKRIYRSVEERRRIVEETLVPGVSVATVARAHGVNDNQVFGWRKLYQTGLLEPKNLPGSQAQQSPVRLLPVMISAEAEQAPPKLGTNVADTAASCSGLIELIFAKGRVHIRGQVDLAALLVILESLRG